MVEGVQRAVSPGAHRLIASRVYSLVRAGLAVGSPVVELVPRPPGMSPEIAGRVGRPNSGRARTGTDFGSRLAEDLFCSPVYVRYNTGRHISGSGGELVGLLSELAAAWLVPVTEVVLVGHSMGGLVARSAVHQADEQGTPWLPMVTRLV